MPPCIRDDGSCKANYPKPFAEYTQMLADSYPLYRRRDTGAAIQKGQALMDNRDVVPYSPALLKKYNAHINVEVVSNIRLVKYIFKYAYKGHDRAHVELRRHDEIQDHIDARYLGAAEAAWRLFEFPIHGSSHTVERLALHLPGQHAVNFVPGQEAEALAAPRGQRTTLTAWFEINRAVMQKGDDPANLLQALYQEIPSLCTWNRSQRVWTIRKRQNSDSKIVGRLPAISPTDGETYYLYLLLLAVPGATGFEDLRTVDGDLCATFQAAAVARGLCDSDDHYFDALHDVLFFAAPARARQLLALILACSDVLDPLAIWETFKVDLSQDFTHSGLPTQVAQDAALADVQKHLSRHGFTCNDFGLPMPSAFDLQAYRLRELRAELEYDSAAEAARAMQMRQSMTPFPLQAQAFDDIKKAIDAQEAKIFFVDGPGGTGKSFLFEAILHYVRGLSAIAVACSWNGLAAAILPGGRTCHSRFGFPVPLPRDNVPWRVTARSGKGQLLARARVLLWDEISTAPGAAVDAADACFQDICQSPLPFAGKVVVFGGDLRQTLPVVEFADRPEIVACAFVSSHLWLHESIHRLHLPFNIRAAADAAYQAFLLRIGNGTQERELEFGPDAISLPAEVVAPIGWKIENLVAFAYEDLLQKTLSILRDASLPAIQDLAARAVLTPRNDSVSNINAIALALFPASSIHVLHSTTVISGGTQEDYQSYPLDYLNSLDLPGFPPAALRICVGALVMLLRNIDYEKGLCNGTRCMIVRISTRVLDVLVLTGKSAGQRAFIPRIPLSPSEMSLPVKLIRRQFPVRLAWALTINKAQGQTLKRSSALISVEILRPLLTVCIPGSELAIMCFESEYAGLLAKLVVILQEIFSHL